MSRRRDSSRVPDLCPAQHDGSLPSLDRVSSGMAHGRVATLLLPHAPAHPSSHSGFHRGSYVILCSGNRWINCRVTQRTSISHQPPRATSSPLHASGSPPHSLARPTHLQIPSPLPPLLRLARLAIGPDLLGRQERAVLCQDGRVAPVRQPAEKRAEDGGDETAFVVVDQN